jgi:FkbM family methyltransferase
MSTALIVKTRSHFFHVVTELLGLRFRVPGLKEVRNPFAYTIMMLLLRVFGINVENYLEEYDSEVKRRIHVDPTWTFIDAGANIGQWTLYMAKRVSRVVVIEPSKEPFRWLLRNTKKMKNVLCINAACWDEDTKLNFKVVPPLGFVRVVGENECTIQAYSLNTIAKWAKIRGKTFIKIDVEGAEEHVLLGATDLLKDCMGLVVDTHSFEFMEKVEALLLSHDFKVQKFGNTIKALG